MSAESERARLEAIVFGRDAAVSDAERAAASGALARLLESEAEERTETRPDLTEPEQHSERTEPAAAEPPAKGESASPRERRRVFIAAVAGALAVVIGAVILVGVLGRPPVSGSDSMAIFDQPQTEQDLRYPDSLDREGVVAESVRYVGSEGGYDVYVFLQDLPTVAPQLEPTPSPTTTPEPPAETFRVACMLVVESVTLTSGRCGPPEEFAAGFSIPLSSGALRADVSWNIDDGLVVVTETIPPIPPADSVFDEDQDSADLNALLYLPDVPAEQQETVRFLGKSGDHYLAAFRDEDGAICLAVYESSTVLATSESSCVSVAVFEREGIELLYPSAAPTVVVKWGPFEGFTVSGR